MTLDYKDHRIVSIARFDEGTDLWTCSVRILYGHAIIHHLDCRPQRFLLLEDAEKAGIRVGMEWIDNEKHRPE